MTTSITRPTRPLEWHPPRAAISAVPYLPGLDGMRAIAVAVVMVYHANNAWLPGGFLGVEVFFVISGYLITLLLIGEHERSGSVSLSNFYMRRARRLLPALYTLLILVTLYTTLFRRDALGQLRGDVIAALTYTTNWYQIWVGQGYTATGDFAPLRHLWSLAVEEQFYLLWPLVMVGLIRLGRRRLPDISRYLFVAALAVTALMALLYYPGPTATCDITPDAYWQVAGRCISKTDTLYLSTLTRSGGLLLGAAFAMVWRPVAIMRSPMRTKARSLDVLALIGLAGFAALCWYLYIVKPSGADPWLFRGGFFVCGIFTLMIIAAVTHQRSLAGPLLGNAVFLWIGTRSYGLYLFHWPIYQMMRRVAGRPLSVPQFLIGTAVACVVTELSYRLIETPVRKGHVGRWWRKLKAASDPFPRRIVATTAAVLVAVSVFAAANLATAELRPNEIEQSLQPGREATVDLTDLLDSTSVPNTATTTATSDPVTDSTKPPQTTTAVPSVIPVTTVTPTVPPTAAPTVPPTTAPPPPPGPPTIAIGDSVMLGAAEELSARGMIVDAIESRQMNTTIPLVQGLRDAGQLGNAVVVHLGTNGPVSTETLDGFFGALAGVPRVVMLTAHADRSWIPPTNDLLYQVPSRFPNVVLVDWANLASQCPGDCFYDDGIHINQNGQNYYSQLIFDALGV